MPKMSEKVKSGTETADTVRAEFRRLECLINNCRHGGPSRTDQDTFWFQECCMYLGVATPMDALIDLSVSDDYQVRNALVMTVNTLVDSSNGFKHALGQVGSKKYFASLAVDAWFNEDYMWVRKFLVRSIIFDHLRSHGARKILAEISDTHDHDSQQSRFLMLGRVKGVLQSHDAGLKDILEYCTDGSCLCIKLAQTLNEERELILNPNADREAIAARRKQQQEDRLPPILKPSSKYWTIKKKAVEHLKKRELVKSSKLYLQAKTMLEAQRDYNAPIHQMEWMIKIGEEMGKVASNLSMIYLKRNLKEEALKHANKAVLHCPAWSKSYCRRALALKALGKLEEAQLAIFNAIKKVPQVKDDATKRQLKEFQKIKKEIEVELIKTNQQKAPPVENPLFKPWMTELVGNNVGSIGVLTENQDILDIIYSFLMPTDVANLERTCRRFATNVERGRRIAIGSKLLSRIHSSKQLTSAANIESSLTKYINAVSDSSIMALQKFVSEVHPMIDKFLWIGISRAKMDPLSFETIILAAFSKTSVEATRLLFDMLDLDFVSLRDFQIAKLLLQGDKNVCPSLQGTLLFQINNLLSHEEEDGDGGIFSKRFFLYSLDLEVMRLAISIDDNYADEMELRDMAFINLNNSILSKGGHRKQQIDKNDPIFLHTMAFHALYTEHIPDEWPGLIDDYFLWEKDSIERGSIDLGWSDHTIFRMWKISILKFLKWVQKVERDGCISDYLLVNRITLGNVINDSQHSPISCFSFGPFLVMKSVEFGGAVAMSVRLRSEKDFTDLFCDYYSFIKLYRTGWRALIEYHDRKLAEHHSYFG